MYKIVMNRILKEVHQIRIQSSYFDTSALLCTELLVCNMCGIFSVRTFLVAA